LTEAFGENESISKKYQEYERDLREQLKEEIREEQTQAYQQEQQARQKVDQWTNQQLQNLKDEGLKFDQNELLKVVVNYKPVDDAGNLDFHKSYDILEKIKAAESVEKFKKTDEKKKIASQTMEGGQAEGSPKDYRTPKDLRYRDWSDLAV
jgi:hypothetical protein